MPDVRVDVEVHLLDVQTGRTGVHRDHLSWNPDEGESLEDALFIWEDGNFACDCNRSNFLYGEEPHDDSCGDSRVVVARMVRLDTGETVYSEQENDSA